MKKKRFPPVWQPGEGLALMIFRRVLTNQAWLRLSVPAAYRMSQKGWDVLQNRRESGILPIFSLPGNNLFFLI